MGDRVSWSGQALAVDDRPCRADLAHVPAMVRAKLN
ncbi:MAG: hypothetical protein JWP14_2508 [Frankiales bacterium]|nr:hypothetical protein [Frankiales bacterium]